jgi:hypothetical protein
MTSIRKRREDLRDRLFSRVIEANDGCWLWTGAKDVGNYGRLGCVLRGKHRSLSVHRTIWEMANGPVPEGLFVCHHCDTPACVNLKHLFLGTQYDNMNDMVRKGRHKGGGRYWS